MVKITKNGKEIKDISTIKLPANVIKIIQESLRN